MLALPFWILEALQDNVSKLIAEEHLEMATLLNLFTKNPQDKKQAAALRAKQTTYIRKKKKFLNKPQEKKEFDLTPAIFLEEEREDVERWFAEQGIETK